MRVDVATLCGWLDDYVVNRPSLFAFWSYELKASLARAFQKDPPLSSSQYLPLYVRYIVLVARQPRGVVMMGHVEVVQHRDDQDMSNY